MLSVSLGPTGSTGSSGLESSAKVAVTSTSAFGMVKVTLVGSFSSGVFRKVSVFCSSPPTFTVQPVKCCPSGAMAVRCTVSPTGTVLPLGTDASLPSMVAVTWSPTLRVGFRVGLLAKFAVTSTFSLGIVKVALVGSFLSGVRKLSASSPPTFTVQPVKRFPSGTVAVRCTLVSAATGTFSTLSSSSAVTFSPVITLYIERT